MVPRHDYLRSSPRERRRPRPRGAATPGPFKVFAYKARQILTLCHLQTFSVQLFCVHSLQTTSVAHDCGLASTLSSALSLQSLASFRSDLLKRCVQTESNIFTSGCLHKVEPKQHVHHDFPYYFFSVFLDCMHEILNCRNVGMSFCK